MTGTTPPPRSATGPADPALARGQLAGAAASGCIALAWLALSWWHPLLTYHFGPPLAAAAWPLLLRARQRRPARRGQALAAVTGGILTAMAALGIAVAANWLRGPTLIRSGGVPVEEVALAVLAAAWGWRVAERRRPAWFLSAGTSRRTGLPAAEEPGQAAAHGEPRG
jgi:hypothetical protein